MRGENRKTCPAYAADTWGTKAPNGNRIFRPSKKSSKIPSALTPLADVDEMPNPRLNDRMAPMLAPNPRSTNAPG